MGREDNKTKLTCYQSLVVELRFALSAAIVFIVAVRWHCQS